MDPEQLVQSKGARTKTFSVPLVNVVLGLRELLLTVIALASLLIVIVLAGLIGAGTFSAVAPPPEEACVTPDCLSAATKLLFVANRSINPCSNFYQFACGGFANSRRILTPTENEMTVRSYMYEENTERLRALLELPLSRGLDWSSEKKVKDFFKSCVDDYTRTSSGAKSFVDRVLKGAGGWNLLPDFNTSAYNVSEALLQVHATYWTDALFTFNVGMDQLDWKKNVLMLDLGGLTLNWWQYTYDENVQLFEDTKTFMRALAGLIIRDLGYNVKDYEADIRAFAEDVFSFEKSLATIVWRTLPSSDPHARENRVDLTEMNRLSPKINWQYVLTRMFPTSLTPTTKIVLLEKDYLVQLSSFLDNAQNYQRTMNNYLTWKLLRNYVQDLGWEYIHANREFYVARTGIPEFLGVYKYCFNLVDYYFPDALGALYVKDHFSEEDKRVVHEMISYMKLGLKDRLTAAKWMDEPSRSAGVDKAMKIKEKLGYPSWILDNDYMDRQYKDLIINASDHLSNVLQIATYERNLWDSRLKSGENRDEWRFKVYDSDSFYDWWWNEVLIPAGELQWPMYGARQSKYVNYGSLGSNMAHHLVHAVDEIGAYYKEDGTYFDWWSNDTTLNYNKQRACFEQMEVNAGPYYRSEGADPIYIKIEGSYVARELIAEIGGVRIAYSGYKDWVKANGKERSTPALGLSNEQIFFLSYAQTQCFLRRDSLSIQNAERKRLPEDVRVNKALAHLPEFRDVFGCQAGSPMVANDVCEVF